MQYPRKASKLHLFIFFVSIILTSSFSSFAQDNKNASPQDDNDKVFTSVQQVPDFPGGNNAWNQFLIKTLKYPLTAKEQNIQGMVIVTFIVEKDGSLSGFKVLNGSQALLDNEAIRILKSSPKWIPGMQDGKLVRTLFSLPIKFDLGNSQLRLPPDESHNGPLRK